MKFKFILFIGLLSLGFEALSQDKDHPLPISDSCLYIPNVAYTSYGSVLPCIDYNFRVYMVCPINEFKITIYNRWGEVVYESTDVEETWDTYEVPNDVYVWQITGQMSDQGTPYAVKAQGDVTVLK